MELSTKQLKQAGVLFVLIPMFWGAIGAVLKVYDQWVAVRVGVEKLERWKCAMGGRPPETIDWDRECK